MRYADQRTVFETFGRRILDSDAASGLHDMTTMDFAIFKLDRYALDTRDLAISEAWEGYHCCLFAYGAGLRTERLT